jgi:hypothetical protein
MIPSAAAFFFFFFFFFFEISKVAAIVNMWKGSQAVNS